MLRNIAKLSTTVFLAVSLIIASVVSYFAATYYIVDNIKYRIIDSSSAAFCGLDNDSESIVIPGSVNGLNFTVIDEYAFLNNQSLQNVDLSNLIHTQTVGTGAFQNCISLKSIVIPPWMKYLSECVFSNCVSLESAEILSDISRIQEYMFSNCSSLTEFSVPESVTRIDKFAFANCTSLERVSISRNVTSIAVSAFDNTPNLTLEVYFGSYAYSFAVEHDIPYVLRDNVKLGDVDGIDGVKISDVTTIQGYLAEMNTLEGIYLYAADANQDTIVDISDATAIQMYIAGYTLSNPIGEVITQIV